MKWKILLVALLAAVAACGDDESDGGAEGSVQAFVAAEDTIPDGLTPGDDEENIRDGWTVTYDKFIAVVGDFRAARQSISGSQQRTDDAYIIDMKALPSSGFEIARFDDIAAERWDAVGFDMPRASNDTECAPDTATEDCDFMRTNGYSIYFEATMTKDDGQSCLRTDGGSSDCVASTEVHFSFGMQSGTSFDDCADENDVPGFAVPSGGTVQVKPTIHGDHWFFDNITQGAEVTQRQAQWIADADRSNADNVADGQVTADELRASSAGAFFPASLGYNLSGAIIAVNNGYDYLEAQAHTLGDYQGEGECPTRVILE